MFGSDGSELILHFVTQCNARLNQVLEEEQKLVQLGQAEYVSWHYSSKWQQGIDHLPH